VGGVGIPADLAGDAPFADHHRRLGVEVEIGNVEAEQLVGSRRGVVIGQPPEGLLSKRDVVSTPEGVELVGGDHPGVGVGADHPALEAGRWIGRAIGPEEALTATEGEEGAQRGTVEVPRRRCGPPVVVGEEAAEVLPGDLWEGSLRAEVSGETRQRGPIDGPRAGTQVPGREERVCCFFEDDGLSSRPLPRYRSQCSLTDNTLPQTTWASLRPDGGG